LIDDARTPLIISGPVGKDGTTQQFFELKPRIEKLVEAQKRATTIIITNHSDTDIFSRKPAVTARIVAIKWIRKLRSDLKHSISPLNA